MKTVAAAQYLGTNGRHLAALTRADRLRAVLDPRALFPRSGTLTLFDNRIVLTGWEHDAPVTVHAREVATVGIAPPVATLRRVVVRPIALHHDNGETLYLMINHRRLPNRDENAEWAVLLANWLSRG
ncbi:MAG TPA: hypothetical protein VGJ45_19690 [Pseudonocardiaceae bacterium]